MTMLPDPVTSSLSSTSTLEASSGIAPDRTSCHSVVSPTPLHSTAATHTNPIAVATGVYVTVHGHFYQPPRENPYLNAVERQPSASPFHDWNERIHYECYRPNAFARILNEQGHLVGVVNNYEYLSFNIGPTLMSWLEKYDLETYQRILEADRKSCERLNGHGNAIAQVYNHIILPLANERDKYTQVRWGKADFQMRFGRAPEGMWLAETAVDYATLKVLVDEGIRFIVLAPSQAQRCRLLAHADADSPWLEVGGSQVDPTQPYRCFLPEGDRTKDYIDIFFYDGPISRDMGFNDVLSSSQHFAGRIGQAVRGDHRPAQLISVATDGETFGHHKGGTEKALAYAFTNEFPRRGWTVSNFAHYLSISPPTWEVELKPVTAWSCAHGVDRWQDDCGCGGGGLWHQQWRRPLRDALDWLRDQLIKVFEESGKTLFRNPWKARDEYVQVILDRSPTTINQFLANHQLHKLSATEKIDALRLLEMQRHALLMYTSCGWFFEEVSRPEGTQILRYAARALELAGDVAGVQLEKPFVKRLATIPSNVDIFRTGAEVYRQLVVPAQITLNQVAAHYAISSLFTAYPQDDRVYCYTVQQLDYQLRRLGSLTLAVGQIQLTSDITREVTNLVFTVLHLGGWDFHCCIQPFEGRRTYSQAKDTLFESLKLGSAAQVILTMSQIFGDQSYNLQSLFPEERQRIMALLSQETLTRLDQLYLQVYRDNYGVLMAFHRDELDVPQELQVAAEIAIGHRALVSLQALERETSDFPMSNPQLCLSHLSELEAIAAEANYLRCEFKQLQMKQTLERLVLRSLWHLLHNLTPATVAFNVQWVQRLIALGDELRLGMSLASAQEFYLKNLHVQILPHLAILLQQPNVSSNGATRKAVHPKLTPGGLTLEQVQQLLGLGQTLAIDVDVWISQLGVAN
jgi:alpha-amylase/alpha-mannosidase (GH57 family)